MNIEAKELSKIYGEGERQVIALNRVNLTIASSTYKKAEEGGRV